MKNKINLLHFIILPLTISILLCGCMVNKSSDSFLKNETTDPKKAELEIGDVSNGENLNENFDSFARMFSGTEHEVINIMQSSEYESTEYSFLRSEVLKITLPNVNNTTVWYAIEYDTENMYAVYDNQTYIVKNKEHIKERLCSLLEIDRYVLLNREYFWSEETLENGCKISGIGDMTYTRFFYNPELENPLVVVVDDDRTIHGKELNMYEIADIAAKTVGVEIYDTKLYKDEVEGIWSVTIYDEAEYQALLKEAELNGSKLLAYDRFWEVIIDRYGNVLYYFLPWSYANNDGENNA